MTMRDLVVYELRRAIGRVHEAISGLNESLTALGINPDHITRLSTTTYPVAFRRSVDPDHLGDEESDGDLALRFGVEAYFPGDLARPIYRKARQTNRPAEDIVAKHDFPSQVEYEIEWAARRLVCRLMGLTILRLAGTLDLRQYDEWEDMTHRTPPEDNRSGAGSLNNESAVAGVPISMISMANALAARWRARADGFRKYSPDLARCLEAAAEELEDYARRCGAERLTLAVAAAESGYSESHLGRLVIEGRIQNAGRKGAPRILRKDLPRKPGPANDAESRGAHIAADTLRTRGLETEF